jgi:hypothetical protein
LSILIISVRLAALPALMKSTSVGPVKAIQAHAFLEVAVAGQEFERLLDEGFGT